MKNICFLKIWLSLLICLCIGVNVQAQPDTPILDSVSIHPQTGLITIAWDMPTPTPSSVNVDEFVIHWYGENPSPDYYVFATIPNPAARSYTFDYDTMVVRNPKMPDPRTTSVRFSIVAVNKTPYLPSLLSFPHHNIQVSNKYDSCRSEIRLDWYPYQGWAQNTSPYKPLISYHVMRINKDGSEERIKLLADRDTFYIVPRVSENDTLTFYIRAERSDGATASSNKTTRVTQMPHPPTFITAMGTQYDSQGLAEISFKIDPASETFGYEFFGSSNPDYSFISLGTFNIHGDTVLTDIQSRERTYYYRLEAWHICKNKYTATSNVATALWLSLRQDDQVNSLQWGSYMDWGGDARYELHRQVGTNLDEIIATITDPATTAYKDDLSGVKIDGDVCYWVTAVPVSPTTLGQNAISNTVCIKPESDIFIPQAFTPNDDGQNDEYKPFFSYPPQEYILHVFDRTGAKVFQTEDFSVGWDGKLKNGKPANEGVYVFYLKFRTAKGRLVEKRGTFSLVLP